MAARIVAGLAPAMILQARHHGKPGDLFRQAVALSSGAAAVCGFPDLFLLACGAGAATVVPGAGCVRALHRIRLVRELCPAVADAGILSRDRRHLPVFGAGGVFLDEPRAFAREIGRAW